MPVNHPEESIQHSEHGESLKSRKVLSFLYQISGKEKEYTATVVEVVNADAMMVKTADGTVKKVFLASIRPPREQR
jgi:hypothetical protein